MSVWRLIAIGMVFGVASVAWLILGGVMNDRTDGARYDLAGDVADLWGNPQTQAAPALTFQWTTERTEERTETVDGKVTVVQRQVTDVHTNAVDPDSTTIGAGLKLDQRQKGLIWYSLYDLDFAGTWTYSHTRPEAGVLFIDFTFPDPGGIYDAFSFQVDGKELASTLHPQEGFVRAEVPVNPGQALNLVVAYKTRGLDSWSYAPSRSVGTIERFKMDVTTDFADINFPSSTLSPSTKERKESGWLLTWTFDRVVMGRGMGVEMPHHIQPGQLASEMSISAPVSLLFFFIVLFVLATLRGLDIHPMNYLMVAGAFFAFHLLFAYTVDHLAVVPAFALSSVVSVVLVVSYMRLVVDSRFAFVEATLAQLVYLVGFSLAHFWEDFTGLTVTVLSIATLGVLMQLTGRLKWTDVFERKPTPPAPAPLPGV